MDRKQIAITGAGGFLGQATLATLSSVERPPVIQALYSREEKIPLHLPSNVKPYVGDLANPEISRNLVSGCQHVIHLAAKGFPGDPIQSPTQLAHQNMEFTVRLLEAMVATGVSHLIYSSSGGGIYPSHPQNHPISESSPLELDTPYALSKACCENLILAYQYKESVRSQILRIGTAYGAGQMGRSRQGVISVALNKIMRQETMPVWADLGTIKDFVHVEDVISAIQSCLGNRAPGGIFNVGSGAGTTLATLFQTLEKVSGRKLPLKQHSGSQKSWCILDNTKIRTGLGWAPKISLEEGCRSVWLEMSKELAASAA